MNTPPWFRALSLIWTRKSAKKALKRTIYEWNTQVLYGYWPPLIFNRLHRKSTQIKVETSAFFDMVDNGYQRNFPYKHGFVKAIFFSISIFGTVVLFDCVFYSIFSFICMFCRSLFVLLGVVFSFFDLRILIITSLAS